MAKSFMIRVTVVPGYTESHVLDLYINAKQADLAALLLSFEHSPTVTSFSVFSTLTVPNLSILGKLACNDLGMEQLVKLT